MRITFIPHCGIDDENIMTKQFDDQKEGQRFLEQFILDNCDEGLDYRKEALDAFTNYCIRIDHNELDVASPIPVDMLVATDYGYIVVNNY